MNTNSYELETAPQARSSTHNDRLEDASTEAKTALRAASSVRQDGIAQAVDRLVSLRSITRVSRDDQSSSLELSRDSKIGDNPSLSSELSVITGNASHAKAIARIYNDSLPLPSEQSQSQVAGSAHFGRANERGHLPPLTGEVLNAWIGQHEATGRPLWIAMRGGKAVGWLSFLGMSDRPGLAYTSELAIYISREAQRTGVGSHLVTAAITHAPHIGIDRLMVMVWGSNQASLNLFQRYGFKNWGCLPGAVWAHSVSHDMIILGRRVEKAD
jgi:L-amino acid N-acyltransferase YncA